MQFCDEHLDAGPVKYIGPIERNKPSKTELRRILDKTYPILMESPITRQFNFPGVTFNGGPGLQIRSASMTDQKSKLLNTGCIWAAITNVQMTKDKQDSTTIILYPAEGLRSAHTVKLILFSVF